MTTLPRVTLAPFVLALAALVLNLYCYSGYYMSDDMSYLTAIERLAGLESIDITNIADTRLMVTLPGALVYALTNSVGLTIAFFCLYHVAIVLLTYGVGSLAFERSTAVLGSALVALSPIFYFFGGALLPDNCLCMWLAVLLALLIWDASRTLVGLGSARQGLAVAVLAGVLTGFAYSAKETGLIMSVPVAGTLVFLGFWQRAWLHTAARLVAFGAGLASFIALEVVALRLLTGSWSMRLLAGMGSSASVEALLHRAQQQGVNPLHRLQFLFDHLIPYTAGGWGLWFILATNVLALFVCRGRERTLVGVLLGFWVWPFLYLTFGTTNFSRYVPPPIQHARYYAVCAVPALLVTAAVLAQLSGRLGRRLGGTSALVRLLVRHSAAIIGGVLAVGMFVAVEPNAGTVYRSLQTKAALAAFRDARLLYPRLPVMLSGYLSDRLRPLISARRCDSCSPVFTNTDAELPARPFVALRASSYYHDVFTPRFERLRRAKAIRLEPIGQRSYRVPRGRRSEILAAAYPLWSSLAEPHWVVSDKRDSVDLFLVTDNAGSDTAAAASDEALAPGEPSGDAAQE